MVKLAAQRVAIVGLGLMGGSLAMALHGRVARLTAVEQHAATRQRALRQQLVDFVTDDFALGVREADMVIFATPVRSILQMLPQLAEARPNGCVVFDLGSTKRGICKAMGALPSGFRAVGGHPMCGKEVAGLAAAEATLYEGKTFVLTRTARTEETAVQLVLELLHWLGSQPLWLGAEQHDEMVAAISHLPYLVSSVLMATVAPQAAQDGRVWQVSASGFRDAARLAGSDPAMLRDILLTNREAVLRQLAAYEGRITAVRALIEAGDEGALAAWLQARQAEYTGYREGND